MPFFSFPEWISQFLQRTHHVNTHLFICLKVLILHYWYWTYFRLFVRCYVLWFAMGDRQITWVADWIADIERDVGGLKWRWVSVPGGRYSLTNCWNFATSSLTMYRSKTNSEQNVLAGFAFQTHHSSNVTLPTMTSDRQFQNVWLQTFWRGIKVNEVECISCIFNVCSSLGLALTQGRRREALLMRKRTCEHLSSRKRDSSEPRGDTGSVRRLAVCHRHAFKKVKRASSPHPVARDPLCREQRLIRIVVLPKVTQLIGEKEKGDRVQHNKSPSSLALMQWTR